MYIGKYVSYNTLYTYKRRSVYTYLPRCAYRNIRIASTTLHHMPALSFTLPGLLLKGIAVHGNENLRAGSAPLLVSSDSRHEGFPAQHVWHETRAKTARVCMTIAIIITIIIVVIATIIITITTTTVISIIPINDHMDTNHHKHVRLHEWPTPITTISNH